MQLKEIIGQPDIECHDRTAEIKIPELFGSEKRRFLVRCVADGKTADALDAATVELTYSTGGRSRAGAKAGGKDRVHR